MYEITAQCQFFRAGIRQTFTVGKHGNYKLISIQCCTNALLTTGQRLVKANNAVRLSTNRLYIREYYHKCLYEHSSNENGFKC